MTKNMVLPTYHLPDSLKDHVENLYFVQGVGELEAQALKDTLHNKWTQEMVMIGREYIELSGGMVLVDAQQPIPSHVIVGILDQVKNKLLDFVLGLQENNITSEDLENRTVISEVARNLFNVNNPNSELD